MFGSAVVDSVGHDSSIGRHTSSKLWEVCENDFLEATSRLTDMVGVVKSIIAWKISSAWLAKCRFEW
jgi:hypothetical protein